MFFLCAAQVGSMYPHRSLSAHQQGPFCTDTSVSKSTPARSLLYLTWHRAPCLTVKCLFPIIFKLIVLAAFIPTNGKSLEAGVGGEDCSELYDHMVLNNVPEMTRNFQKEEEL